MAVTIAEGAVTGTTGGLPNETYSFSYTTEKQAEPANANISSTPVAATTATAKKLYGYFLEQYGQKVISSVMANVNWNNECAEKVRQLTGKYPAMNCYDFIHICFSPANWIDYTDITPVQQWVNGGGIVQLMWHFNVPKSKGSTDYTCTPSETTFKAANALVSGTWENKWFYEQMDKVVATILKLQDAGIAATWRPFHEAAGNATYLQQASWTKAWFWWGYDGATTYKKLWITMFDYFKSKGIKNLIWVWTTQNYNGDRSKYNQDTDWYPGDDYVDMVARDLYGYTAAQNNQEFTEIQATYPDKMVVLGECGKGDSGDPGKIGNCWTSGAKWGHFMVWYNGNETNATKTMCSDNWWKDAMSHSSVITRDQLPNLKE
ncbi:MAG: beta-mannosidase [Prevotella sp.]|nr:beta-mannosidase [Prevotella sp.]